MFGRRTGAIMAVAGLAFAAQLGAQDRAINIFGYGGGYSPLSGLDAAGTVDFKTGFNFGAGASVSINRWLGIRGDLTLVKSRQRGTPESANWRKIFSAADLVLRLPLAGFTPYVSAGGGVVTMDEEGPETLLSSRRGGRFGLGASYDLPRGLSVFGQALGWVYTWDTTKYPTFNTTQFDMLYSLGLSYRLPF